METTKPVLDYYSSHQNYHEIDGGMEINEITKKLRKYLRFKTLTLNQLLI